VNSINKRLLLDSHEKAWPFAGGGARGVGGCDNLDSGSHSLDLIETSLKTDCVEWRPISSSYVLCAYPQTPQVCIISVLSVSCCMYALYVHLLPSPWGWGGFILEEVLHQNCETWSTIAHLWHVSTFGKTQVQYSVSVHVFRVLPKLES